MLVHLSQTNSTYVNGEPVTARHRLSAGDTFAINPFVFAIAMGTPVAQPAPDFDDDAEATIVNRNLDSPPVQSAPAATAAPSVPENKVVVEWTKPGTHKPYTQVFPLPATIGRGENNDIVLIGATSVAYEEPATSYVEPATQDAAPRQPIPEAPKRPAPRPAPSRSVVEEENTLFFDESTDNLRVALRGLTSEFPPPIFSSGSIIWRSMGLISAI
jgi:hypothetical protein